MLSRLLLSLIVLSVVGCTRFKQEKISSDSVRLESAATQFPDSSSEQSSVSSLPEDSASRLLALPNITLDESKWKTYRNNHYKFEFKYPPELTPTIPFNIRDDLTSQWRVMATPEEPGIAVISIPIVHLGNRTAYPRFYDVEFRVGVSDSLRNCNAGNGERTIGTIVINGSTFNQFEFSDVAMMKYVNGISYRTGHKGRCFAMEQVRAGSNYRDTASSQDIDQPTLDRYYYLAGKIMKTFRFLDSR